jgi:glycosyltransferase involved in cell wall biosynthesis
MLVGTGCSSDNVELARIIKRLGLEDNVLLLGNQTEVIDYLSAMDIYIMPSRTEGFPNALAEAMAMSLPSIATRVGDTELLGNGSVMICGPDVMSLKHSITEIINLPAAERNALGVSASAFVREKFSISSIEKQYSSLYSNLMGSV